MIASNRPVHFPHSLLSEFGQENFSRPSRRFSLRVEGTKEPKICYQEAASAFRVMLSSIPLSNAKQSHVLSTRLSYTP